MKIIDISVPIYTGMVFYPGDPGAEIEPVHQIAEGHVANLSRLTLGSHVGTHVDAPRHFVSEGKTVDRISLDVLVGPARVVDLTHLSDDIHREDLQEAGAVGVTRVLLKTKNSGLWADSKFVSDYVSIAADAAEFLLEQEVVLIGIDYLSIEKFKPESYTVHSGLLGAGVVALEGIDLSGVDAGDYELVCLPLKVRGGDGAPARAVLIEGRD